MSTRKDTIFGFILQSLPSFLLRGLLVFALLALLYWQLSSREQWANEGLWAQAWARAGAWGYLVAVILLLPLNWGLELLKWLPAMRASGAQISWRRGWAAILSGATVSMFTPNRVGEYGGRMLWVEKNARAWAVVATIWGSLAQWGTLLAGGALALTFWLIAGKISLPLAAILLLYALFFLLAAAIILLYLRLPALVDWLMRFRFWARRLESMRCQLADSAAAPRADAWIWGMATARYLVYSSQYLLMLYFWGLPLSFFDAFSMVALIYLLQTGLPLPPSTGLVARGNVALFVAALLLPAAFSGSVLCATFSLWIINVFLPAALGAVFLIARFWRSA